MPPTPQHTPPHSSHPAHAHAASHAAAPGASDHAYGSKSGIAPFASRVPYDTRRIHAAAVYCSDGRIGEHFDDFLQNGLDLPRYDRVALPGGPACLAGHAQAHLEEVGVMDELKFLAEVHGLKRVVLIAHEACAFYTKRLDLSEPRLELVQRADLVRAAAIVHRVTGIDRIEGYFARIDAGTVRFEPVNV